MLPTNAELSLFQTVANEVLKQVQQDADNTHHIRCSFFAGIIYIVLKGIPARQSADAGIYLIQLMLSPRLFDRDISWLSFNERVLMEAKTPEVPLFERIKFLSIYSSNLDEFYRVRVPAVMALAKLAMKKEDGAEIVYEEVLARIKEMVDGQLQLFGAILKEDILPQLKENNIELVYNAPLPKVILEEAAHYFFTQVLGFLQPVKLLHKGMYFFFENNKLYKIVEVSTGDGTSDLYILNIPSDHLPRFFSVSKNGIQYLLFLEDIMKAHLLDIISSGKIIASYNIKLTRDGALELEKEYEEDLAEKMEKQIAKRDYGFATRFLYDAAMPEPILQAIIQSLHLKNARIVAGGPYHNLKDLSDLPIRDPIYSYPDWPAIRYKLSASNHSLIEEIIEKDRMLHVPYQSYDTILRFFNEAAIRPDVVEINVTLYRIAHDSRIATALMTAARNGKKVVVLVELKARFDEANNIKWSKKLKEAGVKIIYSVPSLKVHAKVALIKFGDDGPVKYAGLLATGNLNESTARFYTDHILLTANQEMLRELELLFNFLSNKKAPDFRDELPFKHLLVAQFNLHHTFLELIDREIRHARQGLPAKITIKLNNLEEELLIYKLYEASCAGVEVELIVRSICCLIPGVPGMSEHITVRRIIDKYLEHGRIFIFHNKGAREVIMGSADWMNRNIYRRIEVCFRVYDRDVVQQILDIIGLQLQDNVQAVQLDEALTNIPYREGVEKVRSQEAIYNLLRAPTS